MSTTWKLAISVDDKALVMVRDPQISCPPRLVQGVKHHASEEGRLRRRNPGHSRRLSVISSVRFPCLCLERLKRRLKKLAGSDNKRAITN